MALNGKFKEIAIAAGAVEQTNDKGEKQFVLNGDAAIFKFGSLVMRECIDRAHAVSEMNTASEDMISGADLAAELIFANFK